MVSVPYAVGFGLATGISSVITWRGIQTRSRQGAGWFTVAMGGVTWWSLMKFCEVLMVDFEGIRMVFNAFHWIGVWAVSIGVLGFGLALTGRKSTLTNLRVAALSVIPALTVVAWLGDPRVVDLLVSYAPGATAFVGALEAVEATWPWFRWVSLMWLWGLVAIGSVFIVEAALERPKLDPSRLLLGGMVAVPWIVNVFSEFGVIPYPGHDPTVFAFVITGMLGLGVFKRFRLFDVPFARSQIVEKFDAPIIVYGPSHRLYDYNEQAATVLDIGPNDLDKDVREVLANTLVPDIEVSKEDGDIATALNGSRVSIPSRDNEPRQFLIQVSKLRVGTEQEVGHTIQLTDITDRYRQRERIRRERNLKEIIRSILIQSSSRRDIERAFCDHLVNDDRYSVAWIGDRSESDDIVPRTYLSEDEEIDAPESGEPYWTELTTDTARTALESDEIAIDVREASRGQTDENNHCLNSEMRAVAALPLTHNKLTYGVLVVCTSRGDAFTQEEQQLLTDLSESIAFAISAVEQREALQGEMVREIVIRIPDTTHYLVSLANSSSFEGTNSAIEVHEIGNKSRVKIGDSTEENGAAGGPIHILTITGASAESAVEHMTSHADVRSATVLTDNDETASLRVCVDPPTIGSLIADAGGSVQAMHVSDETVEVVAEFSPRIDPNRVIEYVRDIYPEAVVTSLLTKEPRTLKTELPELASLTQKQHEALEAAYYNGFFERPQRQTAEEISTTLGVSRSTFLKHLRTAENKLLAALLTDSQDDSAETGE